MRRIPRFLALVALVAFGACDDDSSSNLPEPDGGGGAADAPTGFVPLVTAPWTMAQSDEGYWCARVTVPEDIYIQEFRPIAPSGTHHTALSLDTQGGEDGVFPCEARTIGFQILFGSGVGTESFALPEGVAFKVPAGRQLLLNLHLYNYSDAPLSGTSGIEVRLVDAGSVQHEAETIYVTDFNLTVPSGASTYRVSCTMQAPTTIFGVFPHMHQLGTHMKAVAMRGTEEIVLHDQPYTFEEQLDYRIDPVVELGDGDVVMGDCSFMNDGPEVAFGDSTDKEMCVLGLYRYPAQGSISLCGAF